jgi:hypothetical protein
VGSAANALVQIAATNSDKKTFAYLFMPPISRMTIQDDSGNSVFSYPFTPEAL